MSEKLLKKNQTEKYLPVSCLSVKWAEAQRSLDGRKVNRIAEEFDPDAFGAIIVTLPDKQGVYHIIDGQHRVEAVRKLWDDVRQQVPCIVVQATKPNEAADIWLKINGQRSKPHALQRFKCAVVAQRPEEVAVSALFARFGYTLGSGGNGHISSVTACMDVARRYGINGLSATLCAIRAMWGASRDAVDGSMIRGIAEVLYGSTNGFNVERLTSRIAKEYTAGRLLGAARTNREAWRGTLSHNVALVAMNTYNHGLRDKDRIELK